MALGALVSLPAAADAQSPDRALLSTFCDAQNIQGATCRKAKNYPNGRACDVKLGKERYGGKFLAAGTGLLVIGYESGCEPHATDFGGSVVFEQRAAVMPSGVINPATASMNASSSRTTRCRTAWSA